MAENQLEINPQDPEILTDLADAYASVGDLQKATSLIENAMQIAPGNPGTMVVAGLVYEQSGKRGQALDVLSEVIHLGYPREQIESLPELENLVADPRFDSLIQAAPPATGDSL
jgi:tetratricopeptide (TPR) repeat protein